MNGGSVKPPTLSAELHFLNDERQRLTLPFKVKIEYGVASNAITAYERFSFNDSEV